MTIRSHGEFKWLAIMMIGVFASISIANSVTDYNKAQVNIACFQAKKEAAKNGITINESCVKP